MKILAAIFAVMGLLALGYWSVECIATRLYQARAARQFERTPVEAAAGVKRVEAEIGSPVARIEISRVGMSAIVVEGTDHDALKLGPGHIRGTAMPGEGGNIGLAGHRDTFFRPLRLVRKNDAIVLTAGERKYRYRIVATMVVAPTEVQVLDPTNRETLTLITCYPFNFVGAAPTRFVVRAERDDTQ